MERRQGRQNIQKQINNPFMQFLRWGCEKLANSRCHSVLAFIVPLSFLEAESYKYARKYLVERFSHIWAVAIVQMLEQEFVEIASSTLIQGTGSYFADTEIDEQHRHQRNQLYRYDQERTK